VRILLFFSFFEQDFMLIMLMNGERYSDVPQQKLKPAIQTNRHGMLSSGMSAV
jgi:hypothetical protein